MESTLTSSLAKFEERRICDGVGSILHGLDGNMDLLMATWTECFATPGSFRTRLTSWLEAQMKHLVAAHPRDDSRKPESHPGAIGK
jgi:hypothetical protein